ncbi:hypothetical protein F7731_16445 [Cytobacillus depressus]|uniref:YtxH domain-containing protein n=1 Tax=Cytobacillus depressus TaxID=1602942 RepID=A0A6L3V2J4_9BACI|nr:hypothetical protein [Cytobacillus depressus]KAB2333127.1 hypothetical protein F7731_16445 [Cytobacillus depressus]
MKRALSIGMGSVMIAGIGASAAVWLSSKPNRLKAENLLRDWKRKIIPSPLDKSNILPVEKAGNPHPQDIEDNAMVSEGALYSVKYYNQKMQ